jgi:2,4-dienoyl-CoA reductase-like NADH-dependent reductase (Old Yellow Enzyme family)
MHLAPRMNSHDMGDSDQLGTFTYVARELGRRKLAWIASREADKDDSVGPRLKDAFGGVYIANEKYTQAQAEQVILAGEADAVAFGKLFISNPDLPKRFKTGAVLHDPNPETFYSHGPEGYVDYPTL